MSQDQEPPLTPELVEQIARDQHDVHAAIWQELVPLRMDVLAGMSGYLGKPPREPTIPNQPILMATILKRYAVRLFDCENRHYPLTLQTPIWRSVLAHSVEQIVMENIREIESRFHSLAVHLSHDEMRECISEALSAHILTLPNAIVLSFEPDPVVLASAKDEPCSTTDTLGVLITSCGMTNEEVAAALSLDVRSVYRHLAGGNIRKKHRAAYERLFTQKLGRGVQLRQVKRHAERHVQP